MAGFTPRELSREFGALRRLNPNLTKAVAHLMLSPAPGDPPLTDAQWQAIAERYAEAMGYAKTAWCGVVHNDTDHQHLHIIACRIDIHGKTISDANSYRKSEAIVRRLERDFGLVAVASPTGIKRKSQPSPKTSTTIEEPSTMTDSLTPSQPSTPPNPFDPSDSQHATWPEPFEPGRDVAELALVSSTPTIVMPGASPAEMLTDSKRRDMRRALVEADYAQRMQTILGDDLTRVYKHAQGAILYFRQPGRISDQGDRLTVLGGMEEKLAAQRIVALACEKRWETISFTGSASFVERAMREALKQHLTVVARSQAQATILAKVMAERQGGMGTAAGPAILPPGAVAGDEDILAPLDELDDLPLPAPWSKPTKAQTPTQPVAVPPAAPAVPASPNELPKTPPVGVLPRFLNLRERLQDRRDRTPQTAPKQSPAQPPKRSAP
ncbi:Relaxase/Mobilisation nuclease domain-containing protein [Variovorax sp. YR634]|nr:Relaxase/Mobilisation nuclease domain-containing protein [Variovorax sp. YR634]